MILSPRPALALVGLAIASLVACGPLEDAKIEPPTGVAPPAGFATEMVDAQNAVRASATPAPSPPLQPFLWSPSAAEVARAWAGGCLYQHNPARGALGENIAATAPPGTNTAADVVKLWGTDEAPFYDLATNTCDAANPANTAHTCGHYTQIVWRDSTVLGCAVATCNENSPFPGVQRWEFWVCDYALPGNVIGQRPY